MAAARDIFERAIQKGLAVLGEPSLLDGVPCGNVHISRAVEMYAAALDQANDNHVARVDLARIEKRFGPRSGMTLVHPSEGTFELTRLAKDDGIVRAFVIVQVAP